MCPGVRISTGDQWLYVCLLYGFVLCSLLTQEQEPDEPNSDEGDADRDAEQERKPRKLSPAALATVSSLVNTVAFLLGCEGTNAQHYKMVVLRERDNSSSAGGQVHLIMHIPSCRCHVCYVCVHVTDGSVILFH